MKYAAIVFACLGAIYWTLRLTDILYFYIVPTNDNLPTLTEGKIVFTSSLKSVNYNEFIVFKKSRLDVMIFRCVGMPGDIVEIKAGKLYRNGVLLKEIFTINNYFINRCQLNEIKDRITEKNYLIPLNDTDTLFRISLTGNELKNFNLSLPQNALKKEDTSISIYPEFKKHGFNPDNLGPIKVPVNSYFVMGDERPVAYDSRYLGFVRKDEIIAAVIK